MKAQYIANATLEQAGTRHAGVTKTGTGKFRTGDRIMLSAEEDIALHYFPRPPEKASRRIISISRPLPDWPL